MKRQWLGLAAGFTAALMVYGVQAQQPSADSIDIDVTGCQVVIDWEDGVDDSTHVSVSVQTGVVVDERPDVLLDDVVGDQSQIVDSFILPVGEHTVSATLFSDGEELDDETQIVECEPAPTPTATATPVPPTATTVPPLPTSTPVVITNTIVTERVVEVPVIREVVRTITPPSTGSGGLAGLGERRIVPPGDWSWSGGGTSAVMMAWYRYYFLTHSGTW